MENLPFKIELLRDEPINLHVGHSHRRQHSPISIKAENGSGSGMTTMTMAAVSSAAAAVCPCHSMLLLHPSNAILRRSSTAFSSRGEHQLRSAAALWQSACRRRHEGNAARASSQSKIDVELQEEEKSEDGSGEQERTATPKNSAATPSPSIQIELNKAVTKTAATFAPRASTASKNPAVPGSTLYQVFEVQAYISMAVGGLLSYNLLFPSDQADIWRLMGMWSVWMFTIPSLRARDCTKKEKEALNYLFLLVPLINVTLPIFWKSFAAVWSADVVAFFTMYAWKMEWLSDVKKADD